MASATIINSARARLVELHERFQCFRLRRDRRYGLGHSNSLHRPDGRTSRHLTLRKGRLTASEQIDKKIAALTDWRGAEMSRLREIINRADPRLEEDWKWGTPVWTSKGLVCSIGAFKDHLKIHFFKGSILDDPKRLFNAGFDAKEMRAIDIHEGDKVNETALKALVRQAVKLNK